ncbi:hypothetical protein N1851_032689 [Merluccius polli]|uniref:Uncharacterized protein n=1 Tax=Merluccius polli TaxID=89951 RepID=A0AA47M2J0_MERPO|nr:hypothetical protein N1851_032689 [Merluccius polli]
MHCFGLALLCTEWSHKLDLLACKTEAPNDSLDFHLKSLYNHHEDFLRTRTQTVYQWETVSEDHGTFKKREMQEVPQKKLENDRIKSLTTTRQQTGATRGSMTVASTQPEGSFHTLLKLRTWRERVEELKYSNFQDAMFVVLLINRHLWKEV